MSYRVGVRRNRTEFVIVRVATDELAEIRRMAESERITVSEFVRAATFGYMALRGNKLAWRLMGEGMRALLEEYAGQFVGKREAKLG